MTFRVPLLNPSPVFDFQVFMMDANPSPLGAVVGVVAQLAMPFLTGSFSEVSGIESGAEFEDYREGGRNVAPRKLFKGGKYPNLVFKRGVTPNTDIWDWYYANVYGKSDPIRKNGVLVLNDRGGAASGGASPEALAALSLIPFAAHVPIGIWFFKNAYVEKLQGPRLDAKANEIAIETMELVHEGLYRLGPGMLPGAAGAFAGAVGL
jgi:phage tail-like protein